MTHTKEKPTRRMELEHKLDALAALGLLPALLKLLPDEKQRTLLQLRHGLGLSWPVLRKEAARLGLFYSDRQLFRFYAQALGSFAELTETADEN
jgi:hypothetical protein